MSSSETFTFSICKQDIVVSGDTKHSRLQQFKRHQDTCMAAPVSPRPHLRRPPNGRGTLLSRLFRRSPRPRIVPATFSPQHRDALLQHLDKLDSEAMAVLSPVPASSVRSTPLSDAPPKKPREGSSPPPPPSISTSLTELSRRGFDFKHESLVRNMQNFREIREHFLLIDHFTAVAELYNIFLMSYIEEYGGYGMERHQKEVFMEIVSETQELFTLLKGEPRVNKDYANLIRFLELDLYQRFQVAVNMATMETLSRREADKQERLLELARAYISQQEDEKGLKDLLAEDNLTRKEAD